MQQKKIKKIHHQEKKMKIEKQEREKRVALELDLIKKLKRYNINISQHLGQDNQIIYFTVHICSKQFIFLQFQFVTQEEGLC